MGVLLGELAGVKEGSGDEHHFQWGPRWETWERAHTPRGLCVEEGSGTGVSPYTGPIGGPGEGDPFTGNLREMDEGGSRNGASLSEEAHCRGLLYCITLGCERKALGTGISLHWGSAGQPGVGPSTGDFERWVTGALEVGNFPLWELCVGNLEGGLTCWGPWRRGRKGSGGGHLFP
jgi:hypothetical protein